MFLEEQQIYKVLDTINARIPEDVVLKDMKTISDAYGDLEG